MSHQTAKGIAEAIGGEVIRGEDDPDGEPVWLVRIEREDGRLVVISDKSVDEFYDPEAVAQGRCYLSISLV